MILKCAGESVTNCMDVLLIVSREDGTLVVSSPDPPSTLQESLGTRLVHWLLCALKRSREKGRKRRGGESWAIAGTDSEK